MTPQISRKAGLSEGRSLTKKMNVQHLSIQLSLGGVSAVVSSPGKAVKTCLRVEIETEADL